MIEHLVAVEQACQPLEGLVFYYVYFLTLFALQLLRMN
jgi:hypothetical protein